MCEQCSEHRPLQAALLHDTLEDTATEETELEALFGPEVAAIVKECTDDKNLPKWQRKQQQVSLKVVPSCWRGGLSSDREGSSEELQGQACGAG